jgi:hypothetical protein
MAYVPTEWIDEVPGENPPHYVITGANADCTIELKTAPDAGTPVDATNLNHIEDGLVALEALTKIPMSRRIGDSDYPDDWGGTYNGTDIIDVSTVEQKMQGGASIIGGVTDLIITFPVAFSGTPIILVQATDGLSSAPARIVVSYATKTSFHLSAWNSAGGRSSAWCNWIAIGPA